MSLNSISPIDGRYEKYTKDLVPYFSESAWMRYKLLMECEYLIALSEAGITRKLDAKEKTLLKKMYGNFSLEDAEIVSAYEMKGHKNIKATNHDGKALEYWMKDKMKTTSLGDVLEFVHFGLTTEDASNIAYALMISESLTNVVIPKISKIISELNNLAEKNKNVPMLARTHGQPASPTTFGKEMRIFASRLEKGLEKLHGIEIEGKLNGATGNYNGLYAACPEIDWIKFSEKFIKSLKLKPNLLTTQIENHDSYAEIFDCLKRINAIIIGFDHDIWRYISDDWVGQRPVEGEIGSSTMPHKINPWFLENSEGNLGMANAMFEFFSRKLPISRLQRDLSDSTVLRNIGTAFAHSLIGFAYLSNQLGRIAVNKENMLRDLNNHPEVVTEAIQTILRREGVAMPYEKLKELTRGKNITLPDIHKFIDTLEVTDKVKKELRAITPENYIGLASKLASR